MAKTIKELTQDLLQAPDPLQKPVHSRLRVVLQLHRQQQILYQRYPELLQQIS